MTSVLEEVAALVHRESGIRVAAEQHAFLEAALGRMGPGHDPAAFLRRASDPSRRAQLVARLIDEVTVKETSFLRDRRQLGQIDWTRLVRDAQAGGAGALRVWSAACATGEEAYTLALLASEAFAPAEPPVTILATDISAAALAHARAGAYRSRSVREVDPSQRLRYFQERGEQLLVGEGLRSLVTFGRHNLTRDPFPPLGEAPFHLILCRNVLIYFDTGTVAGVVGSLERSLAPGGMLMLGVADVLCRNASPPAANAAGGPSPHTPQTPRRPLRRPLGRHSAPAPSGEVMDGTSRRPSEDPLDVEAQFHRGLAHLEGGDPAAAVSSLRRALYVEPGFGLAAFTLGRAYEALGEPGAARRAYAQALRTLEPHARHEQLLGQIDLGDVAAAARARLRSLSSAPG